MLGFALTYCRRSPHDLYHFTEPDRMLSGQTRPPALSIHNEKILGRHMVAVALSAFFRSNPHRFDSVNAFLGTFADPTVAKAILHYCAEHVAPLTATLRAVVPNDMHHRLGLVAQDWLALLVGAESRLAQALLEATSDFTLVQTLEDEASAQREYRVAQWAQGRRRTIEREDVPSFLSRKAVIPKYGFPVDVVELDTHAIQQDADRAGVELQRDLTLAIAEFAPTSRLVANKKEWESYGLKRVAEKEWEIWNYKRCTRHNIFRRWQEGDDEPELECGDKVSPSSYIVPTFGFVTNREPPGEPSGRPQRAFSTRPFFLSTHGPEPESIEMPAAAPALTLRRASPSWMAVLCEGRGRQGFYICQACGYGSRKRDRSHKTPYGRPCKKALSSFSLGHQFVTDVVRIAFHAPPVTTMDPAWFSYSLACALVEGAAEVLDVPSTDMNAVTVFESHAPILPIVLYGTAPGGAGLVARLEDERVMKECLEVARNRVRGDCDCDPTTSCYGCLRSYRNQFAHHQIQREPVHDHLTALLARWP